MRDIAVDDADDDVGVVALLSALSGIAASLLLRCFCCFHFYFDLIRVVVDLVVVVVVARA